MLGSIQMLRGLAASMIVIYHAILRFSAGPSAESGITFLNGGVDIFFVISGFVMVITTARHDRNAHDFLAARLLRIVPLYWLSIVIFVALIAAGWAVRATPHPAEVLKSMMFVFYQDSATGEAMPVLGVGWTLNYEMYFYLLFAATMWLPLRRQIAVLLIFFLAVAGSRGVVHPSDPVVLRLTSPQPLEFTLGMILGWQRDRLARLPAIVGGALLLIGAGALLAAIPGPRTVVSGVPAGIIVAGAVIAEPALRVRWLTPLLLLGDASYALYLTHDIIMHLPATASLGLAAGKLVVPVVFALCCGVSLLVHVLLERPIIRLSKRFRRNRPAPPDRQPATS